MEEIEEAAQETMLQSPELNDLVSRIRAELFVFTLDGDAIPYRADNQYECTGSISCRLRANTAAFDALMTQLNGEAAFLQINNVTLPGDFWNGSCSDANGNFCTHVKIRVSRLDEPFQLCLHEGSGGGCHISGSPFTIQKLAEDQKLGARFGTIDHRRSVTEDSNEGRRKRQRIKKSRRKSERHEPALTTKQTSRPRIHDKHTMDEIRVQNDLIHKRPCTRSKKPVVKTVRFQLPADYRAKVRRRYEKD
ncbi:hypothetical protein M0657_011894 [Pyricularia oryzae]|nr:hypothetical protein M0657_011894 [Pyricularia oryzae]